MAILRFPGATRRCSCSARIPTEFLNVAPRSHRSAVWRPLTDEEKTCSLEVQACTSAPRSRPHQNRSLTCSEPRLAFNKTLILRYRLKLLRSWATHKPVRCYSAGLAGRFSWQIRCVANRRSVRCAGQRSKSEKPAVGASAKKGRRDAESGSRGDSGACGGFDLVRRFVRPEQWPGAGPSGCAKGRNFGCERQHFRSLECDAWRL
jgi:hypothetical protein